MRSYVRRCTGLLAVSAGMLMLHACNSVIYDDEGDCSVNYRVRFRYVDTPAEKVVLQNTGLYERRVL